MSDKTFSYQLRYALLPSSSEDERIQELLSFCLSAKIDGVIFFIGAEEINAGHLSKKEAEPFVRAIKKAKLVLAPFGIRTSINPWFTLGHGDRGRRLKPDQPFQTLIDPNGRQADVMVCPLDEKWRAYYVDYLNYLIEEIHPDTVWLEDDFRLHNHEPLSYGGCFCPEHMALYRTYLHEDITREAMVKAMLAGGQEGERIRRVFRDVNRQVMIETAEAIKSGIKDKGTQISLMTGDPRFESFEGRDLSRILAALRNQQTPSHRIHLPGYREMAPQNYLRDFASSSVREAFEATSVYPILPELENVPHSVLSKSVSFALFQMKSALALGSVGITLSIFDFVGNGIFCSENYQKMLSQEKPFFCAVASLTLRSENLQGVKVLLNPNCCLYRQVEDRLCLNEIVPDDSEWSSFFGGMGIPFSYTNDFHLHSTFVAVGGDTLSGMSNEDIRALFVHNRVLLDGKTLMILSQKGLLGLVGAESLRLIPERNGEVAVESLAFPVDVQGKKDYLSPEQYFVGDFVDVTYLPTTKPLLYSTALDFTLAHPKNAVCEALGHLVSPYLIKQSEISETAAPEAEVGAICPQKKALVEQYLLQNSPRFVFAEDLGVAAYLFEKDHRVFLFLLNGVSDALPVLHLRSRVFTPKKVLDESAEWKDARFTREGEIISLEIGLPPLGALLVEGEWENA